MYFIWVNMCTWGCSLLDFRSYWMGIELLGICNGAPQKFTKIFEDHFPENSFKENVSARLLHSPNWLTCSSRIITMASITAISLRFLNRRFETLTEQCSQHSTIATIRISNILWIIAWQRISFHCHERWQERKGGKWKFEWFDLKNAAFCLFILLQVHFIRQIL